MRCVFTPDRHADEALEAAPTQVLGASTAGVRGKYCKCALFCVQILHNSLTSRRTGEALGGAKMCCYKYVSEDMPCVSAGRREEAVLL